MQPVVVCLCWASVCPKFFVVCFCLQSRTCSPSGSPCRVHCIVIAVLLLRRLHLLAGTDCQQRHRPRHSQQFAALTPGDGITSPAINRCVQNCLLALCCLVLLLLLWCVAGCWWRRHRRDCCCWRGIIVVVGVVVVVVDIVVASPSLEPA